MLIGLLFNLVSNGEVIIIAWKLVAPIKSWSCCHRFNLRADAVDVYQPA